MPGDEKHAHFASQQKTCYKGVEWCFGVLQSQFVIVYNPCYHYNMDTISNIMFGCCIHHNVILKDEHDVPRQ
jgi:hypothetical protein